MVSYHHSPDLKKKRICSNASDSESKFCPNLDKFGCLDDIKIFKKLRYVTTLPQITGTKNYISSFLLIHIRIQLFIHYNIKMFC